MHLCSNKNHKIDTMDDIEDIARAYRSMKCVARCDTAQYLYTRTQTHADMRVYTTLLFSPTNTTSQQQQ